ncbi:MAG: rhomboid family intramembrane serine protease [Bacteroidia bacterium]
MDAVQQFKLFLDRHQTVGWLIVLMLGGLLVQGLLWLLLPKTIYPDVIGALVLPYHIKDLIFQPWSLVTYPLFTLRFNLLSLLFDGLLLWTFGHIHQQFLGEQRTRRLIILGVPLIGLLTVLIATPFGFQPVGGAVQQSTRTEVVTPVEKDTHIDIVEADRPAGDTQSAGISVGMPGLLYASGLSALIVMLMLSSITLVPDYPIQLLLFGQVRIAWVGAIFAFLVWAFDGFYTPAAIAVLLGAAFGFLHVFLMKRGTDVTELVWSFYSDNTSRSKKPRMRVKYGEKHSPGPARSGDRKSKIPQEVIDGILDKISDQGYESLTREEKELLFKASTQRDEDKV